MVAKETIIIVVSVIVILVLSQRDIIFEAERIEAETGEVIAEDAAGVSKLATQSLFWDSSEASYYLMSGTPLTPDEEDSKVTLRAKTSNPFDSAAYLTKVTAKLNSKLIYETPINVFLSSKQAYAYDSEPIKMEGLDAQLNSIDLEFFFETTSGQKSTQRFRYSYFALTPCLDDSDCGPVNSVCDLENVARFSKGGEFYCVKPCVSNEFCYTGQVCIDGRCGY